MNLDVTRDLLRRVQDLERRTVNFRQGVVTVISPLAVTLGGSTTANTSVKALSSYHPKVGDVVAALSFGTDLLVLGAINTQQMTWGDSPAFTWSGTNRTLVTVTHGLGRTPLYVVTDSGRFSDAMADGRAPWATVPGNYTSTTFDIAFATHDNTGIGAFAVPAGACQWIAIA